MSFISAAFRLVIVSLMVIPCIRTADAAPTPVAPTAVYRNGSFNFTFRYPANWIAMPSKVTNTRVQVASPVKSPTAECSVIIKEYPKAVKARQADIDAIFTDQPDSRELEQVLGGEGENVTVTRAVTGKLGARPAHYARYRAQLGGSAYLSGEVAMTATPGLTWSVACNGLGSTPEKADKNFRAWQQSIEALYKSFRLQ